METYEPAYPQRSLLVNPIISEKSFTLIGGGATGGKSTIAFQGVEEWITHQTFFGFPCVRIPKFYYLAFDRIIEVVYDHLNLLGINFGEWVELHSYAMADTSSQIILPEMEYGSVLILDGVDMIVKKGRVKEFGDVNDTCRDVKRVIESHGVSVIGLMGATKSIPNGGSDNFNPMDKLLGAGVWQRISETNILIEPVNPKDITDPRRTMLIRPRFGAPSKLSLRFGSDSRLHLVKESPATPEDFYKTIPVGTHKKASLIELASKNGTPTRTTERWVTYLVERRKLTQIEKGVYRKNPPVKVHSFREDERQ